MREEVNFGKGDIFIRGHSRQGGIFGKGVTLSKVNFFTCNCRLRKTFEVRRYKELN